MLQDVLLMCSRTSALVRLVVSGRDDDVVPSCGCILPL